MAATMTTRRTFCGLAFATAITAAVAAPGTARADVIYTFNTTSYSYTGPYGLPGLQLQMTFDLSDAQVATGGFTLAGRGSGGPPGSIGPSFTGDVGGFTSLSIQGEPVRPNYLYGTVNVALAFDTLGDITTSSVNYNGISEAVAVSGSGGLASGFVGSDNPNCNASVASQYCSVSGYWSFSGISPVNPVPEPVSLALLGVGLAGLVAARRRA